MRPPALARSTSSSRRPPSLALPLAILTAALSLPAAPVAGQQADPEQTEAQASGLVERTEVQFGLLEVVVVDRKGRHVRDIPASAFELYARGKPVPIASVDEIDLVDESAQQTRRSREAPEPEITEESPAESDAPAVAEDMPPAVAEGLAQAHQERLVGPRWFALVFDGYNNVSPLRMSQIRRAAKSWVERNLRPRDMAAVYAFNPFLFSLSGFTNDPNVLFEAIDSVPVFPASDTMGREMLQQKIEQSERLPREFLEQQLLNASVFGEDLLAAERDQFYENVRSVGEVLAGFRGTRAVMLFSGGFPLTRSRTTMSTGGLTTRFQDMLATLGEIGVRVFSYDIGEEGGFTDSEQASNYRIQLENLGFGTEWLDKLQSGAQITGTNAHQEVLVAVAGETGGRFFGGRNYRDFLDAADDDLSHYYLIGYRADDVRRVAGNKKGYVPLKVDIRDRGYRVIARQGEFERREPEPEPEPEVEAEPAVARPSAVAPPSAEPEPPAAAGIESRPLFFPAGPGETLVVLPLHVTGLPELPLSGENRLLDATVTVNASSGGETVLEGERDLRLEFPDVMSEVLSRGLRVREALILPAGGAVHLEVGFRVNGLSFLVPWSTDVEVPRMPAGEFGIAGLVVMSPADRTPLVFDAFYGESPVHSAGGARRVDDPLGRERAGRPPEYLSGPVSPRVPLLVQARVAEPPPGQANGESPLRMDWELIPATEAEPLAPPVRYRRIQMIEDGRALDVVVDLDLTGVEPGSYQLRLTAMDLVGETTDTRSVPLVVGL